MAARETTVKPLFRLQPGVELFRKQRLARPRMETNKIGLPIKVQTVYSSTVALRTTNDLKACLVDRLDSQVAALAYSEFILRWQSFFTDLPYCAVIPPGLKLAVLAKPVTPLKISRKADEYLIERTLGVITREQDNLICAIWRSLEKIKADGTFQLDLQDRLHLEPRPISSLNELPDWFPYRSNAWR